jgi:hypothetical protein
MSAQHNIQGTLVVGEASATLTDLRTRTGGVTWVHQFVLVAMVAVAAIAGWEVGGALGAILGVALVDFSYNSIGARLIRADYRRRWRSNGQSLELPMRLSIEDEALVSECAGVKRIMPWDTIGEVFRSKGYWIFVVQGEGIYAPVHLFDSEDAERAFIQAALARMSPSARERSARAVELAS